MRGAKLYAPWAALFVCLWGVSIASAETVQDVVNQVSQGQYTSYQQAVQNMGLGLYGGSAYNQGYRCRYNAGGPSSESLGFKEATLYLTDQYSAMGLNVTVQGNYKNVVAELPGTEDANRIFIISAHYDHPEYNADRPGGDDNASGSAGVMAAAKVLSQYQFKYTIRFINWGGEEGWMLGSWDYVGNVVKANNQNVVGMLNLDMIIRPGWDSDPNHVQDLDIGTRLSRPDCVAWADDFRSAAATYAPSLVVNPTTHGDSDVAGSPGYYEWYASDQGPFMSDGYDYPGLMVCENTANQIWSGGVNAYYHAYGDAGDRLANDPNNPSGITYDYAFATNVVRAAVGMIATDAQIVPDPATLSLLALGALALIRRRRS